MPNHIHGQVNYALALEALGRWADALAVFHAVLQLDADNLSAALGIGNMLYRLGYPQEAVQAYRYDPSPAFLNAIPRAAIAHGCRRLAPACSAMLSRGPPSEIGTVPDKSIAAMNMMSICAAMDGGQEAAADLIERLQLTSDPSAYRRARFLFLDVQVCMLTHIRTELDTLVIQQPFPLQPGCVWHAGAERGSAVAGAGRARRDHGAHSSRQHSQRRGLHCHCVRLPVVPDLHGDRSMVR